MLLRCYFAFILQILEYCSPVSGSGAECHLQLLVHQVYTVARLCPDQDSLSLYHQRNIVGLSLLFKINSCSDHYLFSELPTALLEFVITELRPQLIHWSSKYQGVEHPNFARCFLPAQVRIWNDLPYTVFDTEKLDVFKGAVNHWLLP